MINLNKFPRKSLILALVITSCTYDNFTVKYYHTGELKTKTQMQDGRKNGVQTGYYKSKEIMFIKNWVNDTLNGKSESFYENGKLESEYYLSDNVYDGEYSIYYESGHLKENGKYENGNVVEKTQFYDAPLLLKRLIVRYYFYSGENQVNEIIVLDRNQDTILERSNFYEIIIPKDTINLGETFEAEINLVAPYFKKSKMLINFVIPGDSIHLRQIFTDSLKFKYSHVPKVTGLHSFAGLIEEVEDNGYIDDSTEIRKMYFFKNYYVRTPVPHTKLDTSK